MALSKNLKIKKKWVFKISSGSNWGTQMKTLA